MYLMDDPQNILKHWKNEEQYKIRQENLFLKAFSAVKLSIAFRIKYTRLIQGV